MSDVPIIGEDGYRYRCLHDWGQVPNHITYGLTHGIAIDAQERVYILHTVGEDSESDDTMVVFDRDGSFLTSWGSEWKGTAHGLTIHEEDGIEYLYITDLERGLYKVTLDGEILWHVAKPAFYEPRPQLRWRPSNVAVDPDHNVYLADGYGSYFVIKFDKDGHELDVFAGPGPHKTHTVHPHGIFCDTRFPEPLLILTENNIPRLHYLTLDGQHVAYMDAEVRSPRHVDVWNDHLVVPDLDAVVTLLGPDNRIVAQLGDGWTTKDEVRALRLEPRDAFIPGKFVCPHSAAFDRHGNIFVVEWVTVGRVTKLERCQG